MKFLRPSGLTTALKSLAQNRRLWRRALSWAEHFGAEHRGAEQQVCDNPPPRGAAEPPSRLTEVADVANPGALRMFKYLPPGLARGAPLIVTLHGCTQTAGGYDWGSGWSALADRHGFAVLAPQQQRANNRNTCFNWFTPPDNRRDGGEAAAVRAMVERMIGDHGLDRRRVFVTGLSAGGAMTAVMLATYPELFAAGAIIAGLPYGCADTVEDALACMVRGCVKSGRDWGDRVRAAAPAHTGPWPLVSIWQGTSDRVVAPVNAEELIKQWCDVHGLDVAAAGVDAGDGYERRHWRGGDGPPLVEAYLIRDLKHGVPLALSAGAETAGHAGRFFFDVGLSSTHRIAAFFGVTR